MIDPRAWVALALLRWGPATASLPIWGELRQLGRALAVDLQLGATRVGLHVYDVQGSGRVGDDSCTASGQLARWGTDAPVLVLRLSWAGRTHVGFLHWGLLPSVVLPAGAEFRGRLTGAGPPAQVTLRLDYRTLIERRRAQRPTIRSV